MPRIIDKGAQLYEQLNQTFAGTNPDVMSGATQVMEGTAPAFAGSPAVQQFGRDLAQWGINPMRQRQGHNADPLKVAAAQLELTHGIPSSYDDHQRQISATGMASGNMQNPNDAIARQRNPIARERLNAKRAGEGLAPIIPGQAEAKRQAALAKIAARRQRSPINQRSQQMPFTPEVQQYASDMMQSKQSELESQQEMEQQRMQEFEKATAAREKEEATNQKNEESKREKRRKEVAGLIQWPVGEDGKAYYPDDPKELKKLREDAEKRYDALYGDDEEPAQEQAPAPPSKPAGRFSFHSPMGGPTGGKPYAVDSQTGQQYPAPLTVDEALKLPKGTMFVTPTGELKKR